MSPNTVRRLLVGAVIAVCVVIVFLSGTGTEPAPEAATTVPMSTTLPWVDRTTPSELDPDTSGLEQRAAALQPWVEANRGLRAPHPPGVVLLDQAGRTAWEAERREALSLDWPDYRMVYPYFGLSSGPDDRWPIATYASGMIIVEAEFVPEVVLSRFLVARMVPELTNWSYSHTKAGEVLLFQGKIGDEFDALRTLVVGDGAFVAAGYTYHIATGLEWEPAAGGCLPPRTFAFRNWVNAGENYVCRLFEEGGWARVNAAYENPPSSTAEILGIACAVDDTLMTPLPRWPVLFYAQRGPLWFSQAGADISGITGWCADHQRVVGSGNDRFMVMEIWLGSPEDALIVETETREHFAAVDFNLSSLVVRDGSWVGIASTRSNLDLCAELPGWCP